MINNNLQLPFDSFSIRQWRAVRDAGQYVFSVGGIMKNEGDNFVAK